ncbi:putative bifunctional UDP-N-acetylglucosamine transferase and deubiquitinase ALG13 [Sipha flava]|jgi:hypothetical protein|uniref:Bifunctional UDP-N-acetylglucosamine transferase and deubiquitinase ALG13 n=1 Tax=Sipha flava TaxID=143950 RepID=A0A8B8F7P9_9HEMI|nr:putative bifunctional UDP-N-acetylglucosamine transferase and deubiquitinase ALG13 [Sipha flava]
MTVRQHLLQFSILQTKEFNHLTQLSVSKYERKITDTKLDGELLDMHIAAKLYKINIALYVDDAQPFVPLIIETPNSTKTLNICLNYEKTYDLVLIKESVVNISFCQAIVYEMLYNNVFELSGVDFAVKEMLFERNLPSSRSNDRVTLEKRATLTDMKELLELGITPFPFKVAKALTPKLYRNTEYDIWLNNKKEKFYGRWNNWEFKEGSKCMVLIGNQEYHCYIQRILGKNEPVEVYVKDLAQKMYVDYDKLKLIPVEQDIIETPLNFDQISSTIDDGNSYICQVADTCEPPVLFSNTGFIQSPAPAVHGVLPGPIFSNPCYVQPYQQQPGLPMTSLNLPNSGNVIPPWYMSTPPPILQNDFRPHKEKIVLLEPPSNLNKNCIIAPNLLTPPNFIDLPSNATGPHVQPMFSSWYNGHQPNTSCGSEQCNNGKESGATMDYNFVYQPWYGPEFDVTTDKLQQ